MYRSLDVFPKVRAASLNSLFCIERFASLRPAEQATTHQRNPGHRYAQQLSRRLCTKRSNVVAGKEPARI
jgi:hypothetical protein